MARLVKTHVEWEGNVYERSSVVEGEEPPAWSAGARLNFVGKSQPRIDGRERVSGRARYTSDIQLPGMLYARVLRSPYHNAHRSPFFPCRLISFTQYSILCSYYSSTSLLNHFPTSSFRTLKKSLSRT